MSERGLAVCPRHGLRFDPAVHAGCVVCRRDAAPPRRTWLLALALALGGALVLAGIGFGALRWIEKSRVAEAAALHDQAVARDGRVSAIVRVAAGPLPTGVPLLGPEGADPDGYPTRQVDRAALRALLFHGDFAALDRWLEHFQAEFEADPRKEYWPEDAGEAFHSAEPELRAALDRWVAASPGAFGPYLARGWHGVAVAHARRGSRWAKDTAESDFAAMRAAVEPALADLGRARELRPKLVATIRGEMELFSLVSRQADIERAFQHAISVCPACFLVRARYMTLLTPRWGGSYEQMAAFAKATADARSPRTRLLPGFVDMDQADLLEGEHKWDEAMAAVRRASALGDYWWFVLERGKIELARNDAAAALRELDRADALRPGCPDILFERATAHLVADETELGAMDLLRALRMDPTHRRARPLVESTVPHLVRWGEWHERAGRRAEATRAFELAAEISPDDGALQARKAAALAGPMDPPEVVEAERAAHEHPDDFAAHRHLDDVLFARNDLDRIVTVWDRYLEAHPDDARGYRERCGTYAHLRKGRAAWLDCAKACELGAGDACATAKQLERFRP